MNRKVSIVLPVYNVEKYIERCLDSIERQTYDVFEIICIIDGSKDNSEEKIRAWKETSKCNVIVKKFENRGVSAARNEGIKCATGEYICFVDPDDMLDSRYLEVLVNALEKNKECAVAISKRKNVVESQDVEDLTCIKKNEEIIKCEDSINVLKKLLYREMSAGIWNLMISKQFLDKYNLMFAEGFAYSEDLQLVWKLVSCSEKVVLIDSELYYYRLRDSSAMAKFDKRRRDGYFLFVELEEHIEKYKPIFSPEFKKYGVAYWVWSTLWQAASLSENFEVFIKNIEFLETKKYLPRLYDFPKYQVRLSSRVFIGSKRLYYIFVNKIVKRIKG